MFCAGGTSSGFSRANGAFAVLELRTRPKSVAGPLGPITMADLPSSSTTYWVARRKAEVLAAIDSGLLGIEDRSEERRVGKECLSTCRSRWSTKHEKIQNDDE